MPLPTKYRLCTLCWKGTEFTPQGTFPNFTYTCTTCGGMLTERADFLDVEQINRYADLSAPRLFVSEELRVCPSCEEDVRFITHDLKKASMQCPKCEYLCLRIRLNILSLIDLTDIEPGDRKIILTPR